SMLADGHEQLPGVEGNEAVGQDTDDVEAVPVHGYRPPDAGGISAEARPPEALCQHHDWRGVSAIVLRRQQPPEQRSRTELREVIAADELGGNPVGVVRFD